MDPLQVFPWRETNRVVEVAQQLVEFVVVATVLYLVGRFAVVPVIDWLLETRDVEPTLMSAARKWSRTGVIVAAVVGGAGFAGFTGLLGGSALLAAAATVAIGFAAQGVLANFVAGMFIVRDPNFTIGDWIEWEDNVGVIADINFRSTRIRTFDNEVVTVPNTELVTTAVTNRMSHETLRVVCEFGLEYGADIQRAKDILLSVADEHPEALEEPSPSVQVIELDGDSVNVQARFWIADPTRRRYSSIRSTYLQRAVERLEAAGIGVGTVTDLDLAGELRVQSGDGA